MKADTKPTGRKPGRPCSICNIPQRREWIERMIAEGHSMMKIEEFSRSERARAAGFEPVKQETVSRHVRNCVAARANRAAQARRPRAIPQSIMAMAETPESPETYAPAHEDIALLVRERGARRIRDGELQPGIRDALKAQEMLDRRAEKQQGRELAVVLARMILGVEPPRSVLPDVRTVGEVIEGSAQEVEA